MKKRGEYSKTLLIKRKLQIYLRGQEFVPIKELVTKMNVTRKTIYLLIKELKNDNIPVLKERSKEAAYKIEDDSATLLPEFSENDVKIINSELLKSKNIPQDLSNKLLKLIIYNFKDTTDLSIILINIKKALKTKTQIQIREYHSREAVLKNIYLTPVHLDEKNLKVFCYVKDKNITKAFNLERMFDVYPTEIKAETYPKWVARSDKFDLFGFHDTGKIIDVKLKLTIFATSLLTRQFPIMEKYLILESNPVHHYILTIQVYDIQPIARFITGLLNEIEVLESQEAKKLIQEYIQKRVLNDYIKKLK